MNTIPRPHPPYRQHSQHYTPTQEKRAMNDHTMTPTLWLLLALATAMLIASVVLYVMQLRHPPADEPVYRTADANAIRQQTKRIIANAATHTSSPTSIGDDNLATARREGKAAALHDMGQKPGTAPTANPYPHDALAHVAWRRAYQQVNAAAHRADNCTPHNAA